MIKKELLSIAKTAIQSVKPETLIDNFLNLKSNVLFFGKDKYKLGSSGRIIVVGAGKASACMAKALEAKLGSMISNGIVLVKDGYGVKLNKIEVLEAGHPVPDERSIANTEKLVSLLKDLSENDLVIALISGGGSSLLELPVKGVTLEDLRLLTELLLRCGAPITVLNRIRKLLSQVKGGGLARMAFPAHIRTLILSDVIGNDLSTIASGPTVMPVNYAASMRQSDSFQKCIVEHVVSLLKQYGVWSEVSPELRKAIADIKPISYKSDDRNKMAVNYLIGDLSIATNAALKTAKNTKLNVLLLTSSLEGEAREVAKVFAAIAKEVKGHHRPLKTPAIVVAGGELTVTVKGKGKGGRCQELALAFANAIGGTYEKGYNDAIDGAALLALGTDGSDGPTDAAGAYVDSKTVRLGIKNALNPGKMLLNNDAYGFFESIGGLIRIGPTGTNVGDLYLLAIH